MSIAYILGRKVLPAKFLILTHIMLLFKCQGVDFTKVANTVSNKSIEAMAMNHFKAEVYKVPLNLPALWQHLLALSSNFIFFFKCLFTVIETLQKKSLDYN